ncbi:MAG: FKBP-type peptidyl-prolyl cis-trans isomerase [Bacteroidetes bacterium]|nr:FKBP-type peptidyl-prolyl cis-trans isomerase [Bacteroidota bacterium]
MKTSIITLAALLIIISVSAQQTTRQTETKQEPVELTNESDTLQYALGAFIGQWMVKNGFEIKNANLFLNGMDDVLQNKPLAVVDSTIAPIISGYQLSNQNERSRQQEEQLFAALKGKPGVGVLPNGVHYLVLEEGSGIRPTAKDSIVFNAIGVFPDGTVFEDTRKKKPIKNITSGLIPGLNAAIQLMPEGSKWRIFVPSTLAYGPAGLPNIIPPNTALVFDITLEEVKMNEAEGRRQKAEGNR